MLKTFMNIFFINLVNIFSTTVFSDWAKNWQLSFQDSAFPNCEFIINLQEDILFFLIMIALVVMNLMCLTLSYFTVTNYNPKYTYDVINPNTQFEFVWTLIPCLILVLIVLPTFASLMTQPNSSVVNMPEVKSSNPIVEPQSDNKNILVQIDDASDNNSLYKKKKLFELRHKQLKEDFFQFKEGVRRGSDWDETINSLPGLELTPREKSEKRLWDDMVNMQEDWAEAQRLRKKYQEELQAYHDCMQLFKEEQQLKAKLKKIK